MSPAPSSAITLRALAGEPLADDAVRDMVVATAHAIAERQGTPVLDVSTAPDRITVNLATGRLAAIGFAAELRRLTGAWYAGKYGPPALWGGDPGADDEDGATT